MHTRKATLYTIFLASLLFALPASSLDPKRRYYQYEFDAPSSEIDLPSDIMDIEQSQEGFLWLATSRGLAIYDGLEFSLFRVSSYPEILSNKPTQLFVDSNNRLFIASERGLSLYDNGVFRALIEGQRWAENVHVIAEDGVGTVWFGSDGGLWQFRDDQILPGPDGDSMKQIRSLLWHENKMIVGARGVVYIVGESIQATISLPPEFARSRVRDIAFHQGQIWLATRRGLLTLDGNSALPVEHNLFEDISFDRLLSDKDENLWFVSRSNIGRILPDGQIEIPEVGDDRLGYVPEFTEIMEDHAGMQWQTSRFFGLGVIRDTDVRRISETEGLQSPNVTALAVGEGGAVLVATDKGIARVEDNVVTEIINDDFPQNTTVSAMLLSDDQTLWVGTERGLRTYSLATDAWTTQPIGLGAEAAINSVVQGADGQVWIATDTGLYEVSDGRADLIPESSGLAVQSLLLDRHGQLWLGTERGVARIVDGVFESNLIEWTGQLQSFNSLLEMPTGEIVSATSDRGIAVFDGERWVRYGESDGIPPEQLIDIEVDGNNLWLFTGSGVFRTSMPRPDRNSGTAFDVQPVVATSRYRSAHNTYCCRGRNGASAVVSDGLAYAATDDGIVIFNLRISTAASSPPKPYIRAVSVDDVALDFEADRSYRLEPEINELRLDYSAIQLDRGYQVEFRYRLLGLSNEWVNNGKARSVQFQNLPPGDYSFELQASFQPDQWSPTLSGFAFERLPSFAESSAYRVLLWSATVGAALCMIWFRMATTRHRHRRLEAEIEERTWALNELNSELKSANQVLRQSSQTDPLTGLVNRRFFETDDNRIPIADQVANRGVVMIIDIDFFKRVNDSYGHAAGDEVLCQFASVLRSCMRQSDLVVRWGGEEFVIICRCPNDDAGAMLDRLCATVRDHSFVLSSGKRINITCSIGCIRYPLWPDDSLDDRMPILMELADAALYVVKMSGRDGWALLEGGPNPIAHPQARHIGPKLAQFVDDGHLLWTSSRGDMEPSLDDSHTRLRAIRDVRS